MKDGFPHGRGRMLWHNGLIYEGEFINGKQNGTGKLIEPNVQIYEG